MLCKRCNVVMDIAGTRYEKRRNDKKEQLLHKRYKECPKCHIRVYDSSSNFQEVLNNTLKSKK